MNRLKTVKSIICFAAFLDLRGEVFLNGYIHKTFAFSSSVYIFGALFRVEQVRSKNFKGSFVNLGDNLSIDNTVGGVGHLPGDSFVLDGKKVTVMDV